MRSEDAEARLEQFTVDARRTPPGVGCGQLVGSGAGGRGRRAVARRSFAVVASITTRTLADASR